MSGVVLAYWMMTRIEKKRKNIGGRMLTRTKLSFSILSWLSVVALICASLCINGDDDEFNEEEEQQ